MRLITKYMMLNKLMTLVVFYMAVAIFLKMVFAINILIPCIWKTLFDVRCPGCGLTTACTHLITCDFNGAYQANPLIFIVIPAIAFYLYKDFTAFAKKQKQSAPKKK